MKKYVPIIFAALAVIACTQNIEDDTSNSGTTPGTNTGEQTETNNPKDCNLQGFAQKGQFVKGAQVTAFAIGENMVATGESFPANISDDLGAFGISGKTTAPYFELRAEGYYFNEITGGVSESPLYLEAFVKSDDTAANINLLTTAIKLRVKKLIAGGDSYDTAVAKAQGELLSSLGYQGIQATFDELDITGKTEADAVLLAVACIIQNGRTPSQITTLIQEVASDLESDGVLKDDLVSSIKANASDLNVISVIKNIFAYYQAKNITTISTVPAFWKYVDERYNSDFVFTGTTVDPTPGGEPTPDAINKTIELLSSFNVSVECDNPEASVEVRWSYGVLTSITYSIPANTGMDNKVTHLYLKDPENNLRATITEEQGADAQYLLIYGGSNTKAGIDPYENPIQAGAEVSVNGKPYTLQRLDKFGGEVGAIVPKAAYYEVSYPVNAVSRADHEIRVKMTINPVCDEPSSAPYYGIIVPYEGAAVNNPATIRMIPATPVMRVSVPEVAIGNWSYLEITSLAESEYLAGTASYLLYTQDQNLYPGINPDIVFEDDKSKTLRITRSETSENSQYIYFYTFPQKISEGLYIALYDNTDTKIAERKFQGNKTIQAGSLYYFGALGVVTPSSRIPGWMELPEIDLTAIDSNTRGFFSRKMTAFPDVRNYSFFWNFDAHLSDWVAYPLNSQLIGNGSRTDAFAYDPLLPEEIQPNLIGHSYGGGWVRLKLIPSASRLNEDNNTVFYMTNIAPADYNFDPNIWANLESQVRTWARQSDTTYVVTGCVTNNSTQYTGLTCGFAVPIPTAFYKAVLVYKENSGYHGCGVLIPHSQNTSNGDFRDHMVSIKELEQELGFSLFYNLPSVVGATKAQAIKEEDPKTSSFWQ